MTAANDDRHGPGVRLHPPIIYAISILAGIGIDNLYRLPVPFELGDRSYGIVVLILAVGLAGWALLQFHSAGTDVRPDKPDSAMITGGPFRYTRNPLYIVLTLIQVTAALWLDNAWVLALLPVSVVVINNYAIAREERYLEQLFGQEYLDYKSRVRRWL